MLLQPREIKWRLASLFLAFTAMVLMAANAWADHSPGTGGRMVSAIQFRIIGFDPTRLLPNAGGRRSVLSAIYERLFDTDPVTNELVPLHGLSVAPADDFKKWRVQLRQGVKFSNGEELTSAAYTVHFDRILNSRTVKGPYRNMMGAFLERVVAVDKYTIEFQFRTPHPGFDKILGAPLIPWYVAAPGFVKTNAKKPGFNQMSVGAGPYMLKEFRGGTGATLVRNPHYWNPKAQHLDEIVYMVIPDASASFNAMKAGQVDVMRLRRREAELAEKLAAINSVSGLPTGPRYGVSFLQNKPPMDDARVRLALVYALDRRALTKANAGTAVEPSGDAYGKGHPWHCPNIKWPEYNPAKAKQLLKEYGRPVTFVLTVRPRRSAIRVAETMQAMWNKVGVKATIKVGGRGPGFFRPLFAGKLHAFTYIIPTPIDPFNAFNNYHSKHPFNYLKIKDPNIDGALARLKKARGRDARYKASCAIQQLVIDQARYISYENPSNTFAFTSKVKGVTKPINNVFDVHRLWIEK